MLKASCVITAALLLGVCPAVRADDAIANGGFETEGPDGPADSANWVQIAAGGAGTVSDRVSTSPATGKFAHHLKAVGAVGIGGTGVVLQNSIADGGLPSLQGSSTLSATFKAKVTLGPGGVGFYALRVLNSGGGIVADTGLRPMNDTGGVYASFSMGPLNVPAFGDFPNDAYAAYVELVTAAGAFPESVAEAYIDDVVVTGTLVSTCAADFDGDGFVTGVDFDLFVAAFESGDMAADFDGDGFITGVDFDSYVAAYEIGC